MLLALSLLLALLPGALADEMHADCEDAQPWIGYAQSDAARSMLEPALADAGFLVDTCEGEQWDGQDSVQPDTSSSCTPSFHLDPSSLFAAMCGHADPNVGDGADPLQPFAFRASTRELREAYVSYNVAYVARGAVYVGTCGAGEGGLEGESSCGGTRELRAAVYYRDNTPSNLVWRMQPQCVFSLTGCWSYENDCDQRTYQQGAYNPPHQCARDNTALGASVILP